MLRDRLQLSRGEIDFRHVHRLLSDGEVSHSRVFTLMRFMLTQPQNDTRSYTTPTAPCSHKIRALAGKHQQLTWANQRGRVDAHNQQFVRLHDNARKRVDILNNLLRGARKSAV